MRNRRNGRPYKITEGLLQEMKTGVRFELGAVNNGRKRESRKQVSRAIGLIHGKGGDTDEADADRKDVKFNLSHLPAFLSKQKIVKETGVPRETIKDYIEKGELEGIRFSGRKNTKYSTRQLSELLRIHNH